MKKRTKIILLILTLVIIGIGFYGYSIYNMVMGSEDLSGKLDELPSEKSANQIIQSGDSDWLNWRGSNFDGKSNFKGLKTNWSNGLDKLWQIDYLCQGDVSAAWSAPVVKGNRLLITGRDNENDLVFCINTDDGKMIWLGKYKSQAETSHGQGARATAFIDSSMVYTFGRSGDVVCWNIDDGKMIWHKNVKEVGGVEPQWGHSATPLILDNKLIIQGGGKSLVIAYNKITGEIIWKSMEGDAGYSASIPFVNGNDTTILIYHAKGLSCILPETGKELWRVPWETEYGVNATTPIVSGNIIFHTSAYGMGCEAIETTKDGYKVLWKNDVISAQHSDPVLIDGYLYGYAGESLRNKGLFKCIELQTGKEIWSSDQIGQGTIAYIDGHLICLDLKGSLYLVKPNNSKLEKIAEIKNALEDVGNLAWTVPVVANGKLYLRYLQRLVCYDLTN
ncbi:MAG: hypothetical protein A2046_09130 [Bacteroidetes bacterium GWA2_30_7]|nr:MAG: hypothetical protein A2046_09130 [Bacteroidetes bacterium GWA2_30_7]